MLSICSSSLNHPSLILIFKYKTFCFSPKIQESHNTLKNVRSMMKALEKKSYLNSSSRKTINHFLSVTKKHFSITTQDSTKSQKEKKATNKEIIRFLYPYYFSNFGKKMLSLSLVLTLLSKTLSTMVSILNKEQIVSLLSKKRHKFFNFRSFK